MDILNKISYGMYLLTSKLDEKDVGCVINTLSQVTVNPLLVSVSVNKNNTTNKAIKESKKFAVSVLSTEVDPKIIGKFGFYSSKDTDKFENLKIETINEIKIPVENMCGYIVCELKNIIDCGTHEIFIGEIKENKIFNNKKEMTYAYYKEVIKGKASKNAPTYQEESPKEESEKYECQICGYIYDDAKEKIKFKDLPEDYVCPICGATKKDFKKIQ